MFRVYLRSHERADEGRVSEMTRTLDPIVALAAYRRLLARDDLIGAPMAAVFSPPRHDVTGGNSSTYFSRFDRDLWDGRIGADDPRLDPLATREQADAVARSRPPP